MMIKYNFDDLITTDDDQVLAIVKNCCRHFHDDPAAGGAGGAAPAGHGCGQGQGGCGGRSDAGAVAAMRPHLLDKSSTRVPQLVFYCWHLNRIQHPFVVEEVSGGLSVVVNNLASGSNAEFDEDTDRLP
jgi:hypothetical protein